jgi:hypothetical protein
MNDFVSSQMTLFAQMIDNDWGVVCVARLCDQPNGASFSCKVGGFQAVTNNWLAGLYFGFFYVSMNLICLNLVFFCCSRCLHPLC